MLISYCCSSEKVCLHLFSWPCLQWMSSSFSYLTNVPSCECTITCWCFRWKKGFLDYTELPYHHLQSCHICDFSKGVNPWFKLKNWNLTFVCFLLPIFSEGGGTSVIRLTHGLSWKIDTDHMTTPITLTCQDYLTIDYSQLQRPHWLHLLLTLTLLTTSISVTALTTTQHRLHWLKSS